MNILNRLTFGKFYKISEYSNWKKLTVKYWLEYSKNQYGTCIFFRLKEKLILKAGEAEKQG